MRTAGATAALAALLLLATGCSSGDQQAGAGTPVGCGVLGRARVVGLLGDHASVVQRGSVDDLREHHTRFTCTNTDPQHPEHFVRVTAAYHPKPYPLPRHSCDAGWVFAGSVQKYAPACQEGVGTGKQAHDAAGRAVAAIPGAGDHLAARTATGPATRSSGWR